MSHRIIEKRRRDRMNNCLADLSRLIPAEYLKKGRGRVEKTEIIEMAIKHMQYLQTRATIMVGIDCAPTELRVAKCEQSLSPESEREALEALEATEPLCTPPPGDSIIRPVVRPIVTEHYRLGYQECLSEAMHFLVEVEGYFAGDSLCVKLISHLQKHCDRIVKGDRLNFPRSRRPGETSSSSGSSSSCQGASKVSNTATSWMGSGEEVGQSSQLREMLCSSPAGQELPEQQHTHHAYLAMPAPPQHQQQPHAHAQPPPTPPPQQQPPHFEEPGMESPRHPHLHPHPHLHHHHHHHHMEHPGEDHLHQHHSYKFKNTIKQRFSEEHGDPHSPPPAHGAKRRRAATRSPSPTPSQPASSQNAGVPIFVLHARGSFYIPLTVSCEVLAPYLDSDLLSDVLSSSGGPTSASSMPQSSVVLHPVTISVNFQQYLKPHQPPTPVSSIPVPVVAVAPPPCSVPVPHPSSSQHSWPRSDGSAFHLHSWDQ